MRHKILTAAIAAGATFVTAQAQLNKEITIERDIVPEVRAASRLDLFPRLLTISSDKVDLDFVDYKSPSAISNALMTLEPAATEAAIPLTPFKGYLDAGYFPAANASVSAGYSILSDSLTALNVWAQLNNESYKERLWKEGDKVKFNRFLGALGVGFARRVADYGTFSVATDFAYRSFRNLDALMLESELEGKKLSGKTGQGTAEWNIGAAWNGQNGSGLRYHAGLDFGIFNFARTSYMSQQLADDGYIDQSMLPDAVHQSRFGLKFGASQGFGTSNRAGVELSGDFMSYNSFRDPSRWWTGVETEQDDAYGQVGSNPGKTIGLVSIAPYYSLQPSSHAVSLKIGAQVDIAFNYGKALHVAPDVLFGLNPVSGFGAWIRLDGGARFNSLQELSEFTPYISPLFTYGTSNIPLNGELGLRVGPFKGAALTLNLAYAAANSWLMPVFDDEFGGIGFRATDLRSWKAGIHLNWDFRSIVALDAGFETRLQKGNDHAWLYWRDGSRSRLTASLTVCPIAPLSIDLGYTMATDRSMLAGGTTETGALENVSLKDRNRLNAGVSYALTEAVTVFGRVENILNNKAYEAICVPEQGITGAIGFGWKF